MYNDTDLEKRMETVPEGLSLAITSVADSIKYNGTWGLLLNSDKETTEHTLQAFKDLKLPENEKFKKYCPAIALLKNGFLLQFDINSIAAITEYFTGEPLITDAWKDALNEKHKAVISNCEGFLNRLITGRQEVGVVPVGVNKSTCIVGLYSINNVDYVTNDGNRYPAFQLPIPDFLQLLASKREYANIRIVTSDGVLTAAELISDPQKRKNLFHNIEIVNTKNAVLLKLVYISKGTEK